jgi:hypothetical protein
MTQNNNEVQINTCGFCGKKTPIFLSIDVWHIIDGKFKCYTCQKLKSKKIKSLKQPKKD